MESLGIMSFNKEFWNNKKVLLTGHTGFKGSWMCMLLHQLGAKVYGFSLAPHTNPSLFDLANCSEICESEFGDINDFIKLRSYIQQVKPEIVIHMAAQALVRDSYQNPVETFQTNIIGTVNLLEAIRSIDLVKAFVNITTDKCYENKEWVWSYRENEPLGGYDPYSSSKACSEIVTAAYRNSFFSSHGIDSRNVHIASARAGNVIGGGDWSKDRLIPDFIRAITQGENITIRSPYAIRPWQFVLEPLSGYLLLAQQLYLHGEKYAEAWNFGPNEDDARNVEWIVKKMCKKWGNGISYTIDKSAHPHEATYLKLDCSKAKTHLNWHPRWNLETALDNIIEFTKAYIEEKHNLREVCNKQIQNFLQTNIN
jgi:CDP-glucose 4,6-dehydratase